MPWAADAGRAEVRELDWLQPDQLAGFQPVDFILATDCVYNEDLTPHLLRTVLHLATEKTVGEHRCMLCTPVATMMLSTCLASMCCVGFNQGMKKTHIRTDLERTLTFIMSSSGKPRTAHLMSHIMSSCLFLSAEPTGTMNWQSSSHEFAGLVTCVLTRGVCSGGLQ